MKEVWLAAIIAFALAVGGFGQATLAGKWQGQTRNGAEIVLNLRVNNSELTGTMTRNGQSSAIAEGKVSNKTLSFKATLGDQTEALTAELSGDDLRLWLNRQGPERAIVLKRVKN